MPVKPLDLQVNFNALLELTRHEGNRHLRDDIRQRMMDRKIEENTKRNDNRVQESGATETNSKTDDAQKHFGLLTEQERTYRRHSRKNFQKEKEEAGEETSFMKNNEPHSDSSENENNRNPSDPQEMPPEKSDHIIDFIV